jgi:hypothetical protein
MKTVEINNIEDLMLINDYINNDSSQNYEFLVMKDLDLAKFRWEPLGKKTKGDRIFKGKINGLNHTIKNMRIYEDSTFAGLFCFNGGTIENLNFDNSCFVRCPVFTGTVCGINYGIISHCKSAAIIEGETQVGGICGSSSNKQQDPLSKSYIPSDEDGPFITCCSFYGTVKGETSVGGICGSLQGTGEKTINRGLVFGRKHVGGICGYSDSSKLIQPENYSDIYGLLEFGQISGTPLTTYTERVVEAGKTILSNETF